jgi:Uma2 family endonuclease
MATRPRAFIDMEYESAAQEYLKSLPPEHFMEATDQATQREITLESLALVHAQRPEVQVFNELLVQYPRRRPRGTKGQVVPDNMVVLHHEAIRARGSFNLPLQPVGPFWVLEYVSKHNKRKDYEDNFKKYEKELKVPYYLVFYPDNQELTLYRHNGRKYVSVKPNEQERYPIPELELELALLDGWVRYWFRGELLPLPADLQRQLNETRRLLQQQTQRADLLQQRTDLLQQQVDREREARQALEDEITRLRAQHGLPSGETT